MNGNKDFFVTKNKIATVASNELTKWLESFGWEVINVEKDKEYQELDIDLVVKRNDQEEDWYVEIKADNYYNTGNYYCETISNLNTGTLGCWYKTQSDVIFYYFVEQKEVHIIPTLDAQEWLRDHEDEYRKRNTPTTNSKGKVWYENEGRLVKRKDLQKAINIEIFNLNEYEY